METAKAWEYYDEIAEMYDEYYALDMRARLYENLMAFLLTESLQKFGPWKLGVEAGGGTGKWTKAIIEKVEKLIFVEPSSRMLSIAKSRNRDIDGIEYVEATLENFQIPQDVEVVFLIGDILSYVDNVKVTMEKISARIRRGGHIIGSVDSYYHALREIVRAGDGNARRYLERYRSMRVGNDELSDVSFVTRCFDTRELSMLFKTHGFEIIDLAGIMVFGPYDERVINFDEVLEAEKEYARNPDLINIAEHIFFVAVRR